MSSDSIRRSQLATPGSNPKMMAKAAGSPADEVFLDLEDSVAPDDKVDARSTVIEAIRDNDWTDTVLAFRINGLDTKWWYDDLIEVVSEAGSEIDDIIVPKVTSSSDIDTVETLLEQVEVNAGLDIGGIGLEVQIEDGAGMNNAIEIAYASDRLDSLIFGPGDYSAAMGTPGLTIGRFPDYPGHYWHYQLSRLNHAAKSAGIPCIDGPYSVIDDPDGYEESCRHANLLGCDGKWTIHPSQIEIANKVFAPDPETAAKAERIVEAYADATDSGQGSVSIDGEMIDKATHKMAKRVLKRAKAASVL